MNLLEMYKQLTNEEKQEFVKKILSEIDEIQSNERMYREHYTTIPNIKVKEKSVRTD